MSVMTAYVDGGVLGWFCVMAKAYDDSMSATLNVGGVKWQHVTVAYGDDVCNEGAMCKCLTFVDC